jgi:hypothetical protein
MLRVPVAEGSRPGLVASAREPFGLAEGRMLGAMSFEHGGDTLGEDKMGL